MVDYQDVAAIVFNRPEHEAQLAHFIGAIGAAERLGYHVDIVTIRDHAQPPKVHSLVARVHWLEPGTAKVAR